MVYTVYELKSMKQTHDYEEVEEVHNEKDFVYWQ